jgi:hypothetical protein
MNLSFKGLNPAVASTGWKWQWIIIHFVQLVKQLSNDPKYECLNPATSDCKWSGKNFYYYFGLRL